MPHLGMKLLLVAIGLSPHLADASRFTPDPRQIQTVLPTR